MGKKYKSACMGFYSVVTNLSEVWGGEGHRSVDRRCVDRKNNSIFYERGIKTAG